MPALVAVASFTNVHEAHLAKSVLEAAGVPVTLANEHVVSMHWGYSNLVGGVKVLVPDDRFREAASLLKLDATKVDRDGEPQVSGSTPHDACQHCGGLEFDSRVPGDWFAILSWLLVGFPVGAPLRRRYCKRCGGRS